MEQKLNRCLICNSPIQELGRAVIMPFIYQRIWGCSGKLTYTKLLRCNHCNFLFYDLRLLADEANKYYAGYWQDEYHKQRSETEWWFNDKFYKEHNKDLVYMRSKDIRNKSMNELLQPYINDIKTVLDYGGNEGNYKPKKILKENYYVYDINNKQIEFKNKYDLIMLNCVLEHVSYPLETLMNLNYKYLYIEVPTSLPLILSLGRRRSLRQYIIDIYKILRFRCFYHCHEHINYWSEDSLRILFEKLNMEVLYFEKTDIMYKILGKKK